VGLVCCWQIFACERVRDYDRAAQWCSRIQEFSKRWGLHPLSAVCRTQYAGVLMWRGDWSAAEVELEHAARELGRSRPAMVAPAVARLGELRLLQGRFDEAARLFNGTPSHPIARLGHVALARRAGRADEACTLLEQFMATLGESEVTTRSGALELAVRVHAARGDVAATDDALAELRKIASALSTPAVAAALASAQGFVSHRREDFASAIAGHEQAAQLYEQSAAPFETARARVDAAESFRSAGLLDTAKRSAEAALATLRSLGASHEIERATAVLRTLESEGAPQRLKLTRRQVEILRLVAQGQSNPQIARRLKLSDHTVKRHVANLLTRLGVASRAAAVAFAAREGLL